MRKLARLLPLALVLLPGCVFHVHDGEWDDDGRPSMQKRLDQLDHRVRDLEAAMAHSPPHGSTMHGTGTGQPGPGAPSAPKAEVQEVHAPAPK